MIAAQRAATEATRMVPRRGTPFVDPLTSGS
jgi:hypothetical protein